MAAVDVRPRATPVATGRSADTRRHGRWALLFIAPNLAGLAVFYLWPIVQNLYYSFTSWGAFGTHRWSGPANYAKLFTDADTLWSFAHTGVYCLITVPVSIGIALFLAVLLNRPGRAFRVYRVLLLLPMVTMPAAAGMIWRWLFNSDYGVLNSLLGLVGIPPVNWLSGHVALVAVAVAGTWTEIGYSLVILLAGLQTIDRSVYEAAALDGASWFRVLFRITIPLLTPTLFFLVVTSVINMLQVFDVVFIMIGPKSPAIAHTQTAVYTFYDQSFVAGDKGFGAAIAMVLFVAILVVTIVQVRVQRRWVFYG